MRAGLMYLFFLSYRLSPRSGQYRETSWWSWVFRCSLSLNFAPPYIAFRLLFEVRTIWECAGLAFRTEDFALFLCYLFCMVDMVGLCFSHVLLQT
ncbi:uncharacterized protein BO87DRAFT_82032 [Aspergillus neoniger CBS 115656]|uniref:Uncharacterized protein n=1 Tax=Aspergillus neoniger (strain CBS 115656) TaxID=1448310 RepID=A0A318YXL5_ASPNB|nr:hypothetical protein BO87DRAFT_82032 [Aspergillus neoniger CBS 115656]PYH39386.1 hypothetical protein BO87DRAFT_82032 [Aspergillus neoniger CBS 115656]